MDARGDVDVDTLLKVLLVLVVVWVAVEVVGEIVETVGNLLGPFRPLLGLAVLALVVLFLLDRI